MLRKKYFVMGCVLVAAMCCVASTAHAGAFSKGLLWKIEKDGVKASYVFGTMHSEDERVVHLPTEVQRAFDGSASFSMEAVPDAQAMTELSMAMLFTDGRNLKQVLGAELFGKVAALMAGYGIPEEGVVALKPWAVFLTLSMPKPKTGVFLDMALYQAAESGHKKVYGLETLQEQMSIFESMTTADQVAMLRDTVLHHSEIEQAMGEMIRVYLSRDLVQLQRTSDKYMGLDDAALAQRLMSKLIDERNRRMVERMDARLKEGAAFIAVGALHLPGDQGILHLLEQRGYRVSSVY